jgi:hypothetical protein
LQYHEVRIDFDLSSDILEVYFTKNVFKVWGNYIYLDTEERRRFAQKGHEYLIEQVQHTGSDTVTSAATKQVACPTTTQSRNWCGASGAAPRPVTPSGTSPPTTTLMRSILDSNARAISDPTATCQSAKRLVSHSLPSALEGSTVDFTEEAGPLDTFKLVLNGQDRFKEQRGKYFNQVQPFNHHSGTPYPGVYSYSFALKPEEHQPTGTVQLLSRIDNAQVAVTMKATDATTMHMFATNYNVLRIQSGMGGLRSPTKLVF